MKKALALAMVTAASLGSTAQAQSARDYISIVGSSTVHPFSSVVAEQFGKTTSFKTPKVESNGSGGGLKLFCEGVGVQHPDITNASRRIKKSEVDRCASNGVREIVEVKFGYDGIVLATSKKDALDSLARLDVEKALKVSKCGIELDQEFQSALRRLETYIMEDSRNVGHTRNVTFVLKSLERMGDHAKNIAESVVYLVKGKDVRHGSPESVEKDLFEAA